MARRRKKSKAAVDLQKAAGNNGQSPMLIHKSLPSLPPGVTAETTPSAETETPPLDTHMEEHIEPVPRPRHFGSRADSSRSIRRDASPAASGAFGDTRRDNLTLPATTYKSSHRHSVISQKSDISGSGEDFFIPLALDTNPAPVPSPVVRSQIHEDAPPEPERVRPKITETNGSPRDYFSARKGSSASRQGSREKKSMVSDHVTKDQDSNQISSHAGTPHIAYQEKGRKPSSELTDTIRKRKEPLVSISSPNGNVATPPNGSDITHIQHASSPTQSEDSKSFSIQNEMFKLQEVPKGKKSGGSARSSRSEASSPLLNASSMSNTTRSISASIETPNQNQLKEQTIVIPSTGSPKSFQPKAKTDDSAGTYQEPREDVDTSPDSARSAPSVIPSQLLHKPKREDSLGASQGKKSVPRKEVPSANQSKSSASSQRSHTGVEDSSSGSSATTTQNSPVTQSQVNGSKTLLHGPVSYPAPMESHEVPVPPVRAKGRGMHSSASSKDSFTAPRAPPQPPADTPKSPEFQLHSLSMQTSPLGDQKPSPKLPRYSGGGEFSMDEDMARILGSEEAENSTSFLRRVSHSVRHGRSYSDKGTRMSNPQRWPKSPLTGSTSAAYTQDMSSPITASPDAKEENIWLRNQMRRMELKNAEQENIIADLKARLDGTANIKQVNTELSEKRSTMVVLDAQKEIVIRELEILTDRIAAAQNSNEPFDVDKMMSEVLRDFAVALQQLKESLSSQIEDLIQKRNRLIDEISNLTQMKEKDQQEYESLIAKNSQLGELNNQLVVQIKEFYNNRGALAGPGGANFDGMRLSTNGLGIYAGNQDHRSDGSSWDSRDTRGNEGSLFGSQAQLQHDYEAEPATVLTAPQVVNIRKGQPKKSMWKKGGQTVAKGVSKGFKGAFSSNAQNQYHREGQIQESVPYGQLPSEQGGIMGRAPHEASRPSGQGPFGLFGGAQKYPSRAAHLKGQSNGSMPNIVTANASHLFGSELESRAEYERRPIPSIVTRCIEEVQLRGMDIEGIYRKSGGAGQVKIIQEGFEASEDYDISDPDLDINAVTSALKQYFRKLPTPLVTYDVYDKILESNDIPDTQQRVSVLTHAIHQLPQRHRDCFNFLIFHLARVAEREKENLMTPLNLAVVFAPTIMRPLSLEREMNDMHMKNQAIQFLIENNEIIFAGPQPAI
ncbi:MAG: Rho-type gtpase-activating protein [Candelina submexicana]|nr:MAG: Rho-type gtpase-activating protein [Candelina submexicana]